MIITIVAQANNRVIGNNNQLIWHLPNDLKRFKRLTTGFPIVMGRNTFESIGKPLPNRTNIVISKTIAPQTGIVVVDSLQSAIDVGKALADKLFVIGGGKVYDEAIYQSDVLEVTMVNTIAKGDTYFPEIDELFWEEIKRESYQKDDKHAFDYDFVTYKKRAF